MKRTYLTPIFLATLMAVCAAQSEPAGANPASQSTGVASSPDQAQAQGRLPAGVVIAAELSKSVDAKKVKPGDKVEAKVSMDLLSQGKIVVPRDSKILGHVTEAKSHSKDSPDSALGIVFDRLQVKDGDELQMQGAIQAIGRPLQQVSLGESTPVNDASMPSAGAPSMSGAGMGGTMPRSSSPAEGYPSGSPPSAADVGSAPSSGPTPLAPTSQGVVGIKGLDLKSSADGSLITSEKDNVKLESGTQLILRTR